MNQDKAMVDIRPRPSNGCIDRCGITSATRDGYDFTGELVVGRCLSKRGKMVKANGWTN